MTVSGVTACSQRSRPLVVSWILRCWESKPWITDAKKGAPSLEGAKEDLRIEDRFAGCVVADAAGFAVAEVLDVTCLVDFLLPMVIRPYRSCGTTTGKKFDISWLGVGCFNKSACVQECR